MLALIDGNNFYCSCERVFQPWLQNRPLAILKHIYRPGYKYAKAGVMLMDLQPATRQQLTLDLDADMPENRIRLMQAMDQINRRFGRGSLVLGSAGGIGAQPVWGMKQERLSSGFTTDWRGLAVAGIEEDCLTTRYAELND
jgi:hypothetical protein